MSDRHLRPRILQCIDRRYVIEESSKGTLDQAQQDDGSVQTGVPGTLDDASSKALVTPTGPSVEVRSSDNELPGAMPGMLLEHASGDECAQKRHVTAPIDLENVVVLDADQSPAETTSQQATSPKNGN